MNASFVLKAGLCYRRRVTAKAKQGAKGRNGGKQKQEAAQVQRSGVVALIGRPNVGKSTLLNAALKQPLAIVSPQPQTTRVQMLGIVHHGSAEIAFLDTPGLHKPRTELGRRMNQAARDAVQDADVIVFVTDIPVKVAKAVRGERKEAKAGEQKSAEKQAKSNAEDAIVKIEIHPGDRVLLSDLPEQTPVLLVLNKVDRLKDKKLLLPVLQSYSELRAFSAMVPVSARRADGVLRVLDEVAALCPEGEFKYGPDEMTDKPMRFFAAEYVREQILKATLAEVPHAAAVVVERYAEPAKEGAAIQIDATIHVEREGQKKILIGAQGAMLKRIGTDARKRLEALTESSVYLKLWVRVTPDWRQSKAMLEELFESKSGHSPDAELGDSDEALAIDTESSAGDDEDAGEEEQA